MMARSEAWLRVTSSAAVGTYKYSQDDAKFERKGNQILLNSDRIGRDGQHVYPDSSSFVTVPPDSVKDNLAD
jgi:hypothetical protein